MIIKRIIAAITVILVVAAIVLVKKKAKDMKVKEPAQEIKK